MIKLVRIIKDNNYTDYSPQDLIQKDLNKFAGWKCSAGSEGLFIDWDGNIWPGTCFVGHNDYLMGNINNTESIKLHDSYITCKFKMCPCLLEIYLPKYKGSINNLIESQESNTNTIDENFTAISRASDFDRGTKYIMWAFGRKCNFSCSYCDDVSHSKLDSDLVTYEAIQKVKKYAELYRQNKPIQWSFTGGEPTINKYFLELVKELKEMGDTITVATNGSASSEYYAELAQYANINISVHFEFLKAAKLKKVTSAIIESNPDWFGLNFMAMPGNVEKCYDYYNELLSIKDFAQTVNCHFDMLRVKNEDEYHYYSDNDIKLLQELGQL